MSDMQKIDVQKQDPEHYALVKSEQDKLRKQCAGRMVIARLCPYCKHKIDEAVQGIHGYTFAKCERCGECVIFPPMSFRRKYY